jgi:uncharacterized protein
LAQRVFLDLNAPQLVTSELVLVEALNHASGIGPLTREKFANLADGLLGLSFRSQCIRQNESLRHEALQLYRSRPDKNWSYVDCTSFVIMQKLGIKEALTADHHFEQAGFTILLK